MRIAVCVLAVESDALKKGDYLLSSLRLVGGEMVDIDGLTYDIAYRHARVKARIGPWKTICILRLKGSILTATLFSLSKITFPS